jgi:hypothetical protein
LVESRSAAPARAATPWRRGGGQGALATYTERRF